MSSDATERDAPRGDEPEYTAVVVRRKTITPHMVRLTLGGIARAEKVPPFASSGLPDEFFGLWVPLADGGAEKRYYTVRAVRPDDGEIDVDLLLHGHGPATEWAARAAPGDMVAFDATRGHFRPPANAGWIALCGDATALPAIGRILDERAARAGQQPRVHVVIALDDPADRQDFPLRPDDSIRWTTPAELVEIVLDLADATSGEGYLWFSSEAAQMRAIRTGLRRVRAWPSERWMTMGYWRRDSETWRSRWEAAGERFQRELEAVYDSGDDPEIVVDRAEELLAKEGLL